MENVAGGLPVVHRLESLGQLLERLLRLLADVLPGVLQALQGRLLERREDLENAAVILKVHEFLRRASGTTNDDRKMLEHTTAILMKYSIMPTRSLMVEAVRISVVIQLETRLNRLMAATMFGAMTSLFGFSHACLTNCPIGMSVKIECSAREETRA